MAIAYEVKKCLAQKVVCWAGLFWQNFEKCLSKLQNENRKFPQKSLEAVYTTVSQKIFANFQVFFLLFTPIFFRIGLWI